MFDVTALMLDRELKRFHKRELLLFVGDEKGKVMRDIIVPP
jgi:hypothetical protein